MPIKKGYMKRTERGYHPAEYFGPLLVQIAERDYSEYVKFTRAKKIEGEAFPIVVLSGSRDVLRELELRYETKVRDMFRDKTYDEINRLTAEDVMKRVLKLEEAKKADS